MPGAAALEDQGCVCPRWMPVPALPSYDHGRAWAFSRCCVWVSVTASARSRSKPPQPHMGILEDTPALSLGCGGRKSCCKVLSIFSSHRSQRVQKSTQAEARRTFPSPTKCFPWLLWLTSAKLFGAEGCAVPQGSLQAGGLDGPGNAACSTPRNRQGEGKWHAELKVRRLDSICIWMPAHAACTEVTSRWAAAAAQASGGAPCKARHPTSPCKAAMNPFRYSHSA